MVSALNDAGFFVEPSQVIIDEHTGKSREIDIVAEYFHYSPENERICVKTHFVIEAINNLYPLVLTTERPSSPHVAEEYYFKYWCTPEENTFGEIDYLEGRWLENKSLYAQYCAITKKKTNELMASHSDDLYSSITKMVKYCSSQSVRPNWAEASDKFWRVFFWQPILVLQNDILVHKTNENGEDELVEVDNALLEFNYHTDGEPDSIVIEVVKENKLVDHLKGLAQRDKLIENKLGKLRASKSI